MRFLSRFFITAIAACCLCESAQSMNIIPEEIVLEGLYMWAINKGVATKKVDTGVEFLVKAWRTKNLAQKAAQSLTDQQKINFVSNLITNIEEFKSQSFMAGLIIPALAKQSFNNDNSLIARLFKTGLKDVPGFFATEVATDNKLLILCDEFVHFFNNLEISLRDDAFENYAQTLAQETDFDKAAFEARVQTRTLVRAQK